MLWENKTAKWLGRSHRHADCHRCGCGGWIIWKVLVIPTSDKNDREEFCTEFVCLEGRLQILFFSCHKCKIGKINNQFYFWDSFTVLHKGNFSTAWKELLTQRLLRHVNLSFSETHTSSNCGTDSTLCGVLQWSVGPLREPSNTGHFRVRILRLNTWGDHSPFHCNWFNDYKT